MTKRPIPSVPPGCIGLCIFEGLIPKGTLLVVIGFLRIGGFVEDFVWLKWPDPC
jgi:hypothetical protein